MKIYKITVDAYVSARDMDEAMSYAEDFSNHQDPSEWDSFTVNPPVEVVDYEPIGDE